MLGACLVYILYEIFDEWLNYNSLHVLNDTLGALRAEHLGWQSKENKGTLKLRDGSESVHEPLMLF